MFQIHDYVVYQRKVCEIVDMKESKYHNSTCYVLVPMDDPSLKIQVPVDNPLGAIRPLLSKEEVEQLIQNIPHIPVLDCNDKMMDNHYKELLHSGKLEDLVCIIKTTYLRNQERVLHNKKIGDKDHTYFEMAERYLYQELSIVLNMSYEDTKQYVIDQVESYVASMG